MPEWTKIEFCPETGRYAVTDDKNNILGFFWYFADAERCAKYPTYHKGGNYEKV